MTQYTHPLGETVADALGAKRLTLTGDGSAPANVHVVPPVWEGGSLALSVQDADGAFAVAFLNAEDWVALRTLIDDAFEPA